MDEDTNKEFEHCKNDNLRQLGELGHLAKEVLRLKERVTSLEYTVYQMRRTVDHNAQMVEEIDSENGN